MKIIIKTSLLVFLLLAVYSCKNKTASKLNAPERKVQKEKQTSTTKEITKTIRGFYSWYQTFNVDEKRNVIYTKEINNHLVLDEVNLNIYLKNIKGSSFISDAFIISKKKELKDCEKNWQNEPLDEPASCLDYDRFTCSQDVLELLMDFYLQTPINIISEDKIKATVLLKSEYQSQKFDLVKINNQWLINNIYCE